MVGVRGKTELEMPIDKETVSRLMHLTHVPNEAEREESLSHCHICLRRVQLTKEHIPPKKAYNSSSRLWDRLIFSNGKAKARSAHIRGGLWVETICADCNNSICSGYAKEYVKLVRQLVEKPTLFDPTGAARIVSVNLNTLLIAKEIATMILAAEQLSFAKHHAELRRFVLNANEKIRPPFQIYAFLVPEVPESGTVVRFHARVETYAPGYRFQGGEISCFPFGFVYASAIGRGYEPERMTDISNWFWEDPGASNLLRLFCRITGVDSIQSLLGAQRIRPQIDHISERFTNPS